MDLSREDRAAEEPRPARTGRHRQTADHPGLEPGSRPTRAGRHRRPCRPRLTADQVGNTLKLARALYWAIEELRKHETPIGEHIHTLMGVVQQAIDAISSFVG